MPMASLLSAPHHFEELLFCGDQKKKKEITQPRIVLTVVNQYFEEKKNSKTLYHITKKVRKNKIKTSCW